ncbi:hypothetical protein VNO77_24885 [Canavalia gladiata]|uniref:Uncharacterized protein n=1 Tax=Canavalia gladiata TaxID=3824 RepID=A0AAN9L737_CANGL
MVSRRLIVPLGKLLTISKGIHGKGRALSKKLDSDGKVDTMQTLHNINEALRKVELLFCRSTFLTLKKNGKESVKSICLDGMGILVTNQVSFLLLDDVDDSFLQDISATC